MNKDEQLLYADHIRHFYTLRYGFPPMVGRLLGYLFLCVPEKQSMSELADALMASRSAIAGAVQTLENYHFVNRTRAAGQRSDSISLNPAGIEGKGFDATVYQEQAALFREGLNALKDEGQDPRISMLEEAAALAEFLAEQIPALHTEWYKRRAALRRNPSKETSKDVVQ
jgi:DNA-binding MarR family transcriptional regulator